MDFDDKTINEITGGLRVVPKDWMTGTGPRNLLLDDPALLWLQFHGKDNGFKEDEGEYSLSHFIMEAGRDFEAAWIRNVAPEAVQALRDDRDVRRVEGLLRTIELIKARTPVISHAALWNASAKIYGAADIICLTSWLYSKFPHLKPAKPEPDHYVVLDIKFTSGLQKPAKAKSLAVYSAQVRLYTYMLAYIEGSHMPAKAYLITRDRHDDPIPVEITSKIGKKLDKDLMELRDRFLDIKLNGGKYKPWEDDVVKPNFTNALNAPWSSAVQQIATEYMSDRRPLEWLPKVGRAQADALKKLGYASLDDILAVDPDTIPLEKIKGLGLGSARQIRAVLRANQSHKITKVPTNIIPRQKKIEFFIDYEFFPNLNIRYNDEPWPECLAGRELIFLIGCGYLDKSAKWHYKQFVAEREDYPSEKKMFEQFTAFLKSKGALEPGADVNLWHYSPAEVWQSKKAATRTGIKALADLPWNDAQKVLLQVPLGTPSSFSFGLKTIAKAISIEAPEYAISWPSGLGDGAAASVVGFEMYESKEPLKTKEYELLGKYLESDCHSLERVLSWLRASGGKDDKTMGRVASMRWWNSQRCYGQTYNELAVPSRGWYRTLAKH